MIHQVFAVRDVKLGAYNVPMFAKTVGLMQRSFEDEVNRKDDNNLMARHPEDYWLFHLGSYDDENGQFKNYENPILLCQGDQVLVK